LPFSGERRKNDGRKISAPQDTRSELVAYGFRGFSLEEYFQAAADLGLSAVEVDYGWLPHARNKILVEPSKEEITKVTRLEKVIGVKVVLLEGSRTDLCNLRSVIGSVGSGAN